MKFQYIVFILIAIFFSCASSGQNLLFKSGSDQAVIIKQYVVAAELGEDVVGNTRVIVTVDDVGLGIINKFLAKNINRDMDILFGTKVISSSIPIRTDYFLKDIIIPFKDKKLAKEFYDVYGAP